jgi:hypothetical protein
MNRTVTKPTTLRAWHNQSVENPELHEMIRLTGIPLLDKPSALELERAIEQFRQRRRTDLMHFLARVIARDIGEHSPATTEG